jgi:hypothetical protein
MKTLNLLTLLVFSAALLGGCGAKEETTDAAPPVQQDNPKGLNVQEDKGTSMSGAPGGPPPATSRAGAGAKAR